MDLGMLSDDEWADFARSLGYPVGPMSTPEVEEEIFRPDPVVIYRAGMLRKAGYSEEASFLIAEDLAVDLHLALELPKKGCDLTLALRILL
jgi:hypothetical protein